VLCDITDQSFQPASVLRCPWLVQEYNKQLQETGKDDQLTAMREITFELAAPAGELRRQRDTIQVCSLSLNCHALLLSALRTHLGVTRTPLNIYAFK